MSLQNVDEPEELVMHVFVNKFETVNDDVFYGWDG